MKILVINGPNLNMLGIREPQIYGKDTLASIMQELGEFAGALSSEIELEFFQSNHEGEIVEKIQSAYGKKDGIIINPAAYTHTSVAIADAISAVGIKTIEVHLSNIYAREDFRHTSLIAKKALAQISGLGKNVYKTALFALFEELKNE